MQQLPLRPEMTKVTPSEETGLDAAGDATNAQAEHAQVAIVEENEAPVRVEDGKEATKTVWFETLVSKADEFEEVELPKPVHVAKTLSDSSAYLVQDSRKMLKNSSSLKSRDAPEGSRSSACRLGELTLTAAIPNTKQIACFSRFVVTALSAVIAFGAVGYIAVAHSRGDICGSHAIYSIGAICIVELCLLLWAVMTKASHMLLTITPTEFHLSRTSRRLQEAIDDVIQEKETYRLELSILDHLCYKQISGRTRDLVQAEIQTTFDFNGEMNNTLLLLEGTKKHVLGTEFSIDEINWLVYEINQVLANIRNMHLDP